jgi:hypothetical protein
MYLNIQSAPLVPRFRSSLGDILTEQSVIIPETLIIIQLIKKCVNEELLERKVAAPV